VTAGKNVPGRADHGETVLAVVSRGLRGYAKLGVHVLAAVAAAIATLASDGGTAVQWLQVLAQALLVAGVWVASNTVPGAKYAKSIVSAASAALAVLIPALIEGRNAFEGGTLVNMIIAVAGALGVWGVPNTTAAGVNVIALAARLRAEAGPGGA
jgi:hypothetical protein